MSRSLVAELWKLAKRPALRVIVGIWLTMTVIFGYIFPYVNYTGTPAGPDADASARVLAEALPSALVPSAVQGFPMFAGGLALLIGVLATGGEYGWDTVKVLFTMGPRRLWVLLGKLLALTVTMLAVVLATFLVDAAASLVVASITNRSVTWPPLGELLTGIVGGWLMVGTWCLAGAFFAVAARGTALAAGIGLVWALAVENLLRIFAAIVPVMDVVQRFTPGTNAGAIAAALGVGVQGEPGGTPGVTDVVDGTTAALVLVSYVVVFVAASSVLVRRRDVT